MKRANHSFQFLTASYLTQIDRQMATSLVELRGALEECSDASVFYHTFQSLGRHHFLTQGFSNDFAQWVLAGLNERKLAEQLGALDVRSYVDLNELRKDILRIVDEFCRSHPDGSTRQAFEPFHFCASVEVHVPLGLEAWTLEEFRRCLERISHASFHFHFLVSRLRLRLRSNDFSVWLSEALGLEKLAKLANRIDVATNTLDSAKARLLTLVDRELAA